MSRARAGLAQGLVLSLASAFTVFVVVMAWGQLTEDASRFLVPLFFVGLVNAGIGAVARWLRWPLWGVVALQVAVAGTLVLETVTGSLLPGPDALAEFGAAVRDAMDSSTRYAAPVPANVPPVTPLLLMGGAAGMLLVDLVAVSWQRVALAGLPLLALYSLPVSLPGGGVSWLLFSLMAGGYLFMLFLQHDEHLSRWGRGLNPQDEEADPTSFGVRTGAVRGAAFAMGGIATALAIVVPVALPSAGLDLFDGPGLGTGDDVVVESPMVDLRRDLQRGEDVPLLRVTTPGPRPDYVRISVLTRYTGEQWTPGDRDIPTTQPARGVMPALQGVSDLVGRQESSFVFNATDEFKSTWLPAVSSVTSIDASGDWRFDRSTMDYIASSDGLTTAGRQWEMNGVDLTYDETSLDQSRPGSTGVSLNYLELPRTLPRVVRDLASQVTADAPTPFRKARALQDWFRTNFTYNLDVEAVDNDALETFLSEGGREGYCEQFAATMALMARSLGIPARVSVGFLTPAPVSANVWQFSAHDLHAWPELFFPGSGWVRFEPTPADRAPDTPTYTQAELPAVNPTVGPSTGATEDEALPDRTTEDPSAVAGDEADGSGTSVPWRIVAGVLAGIALVVVLLLLPRLVRQRRRQRRWQAGDVESAWQELRDSVVDLGHRWPSGRSPRAAGLAVAGLFGGAAGAGQQRPARGPELAPEAVAALDRLVVRVERSRYARPDAPGLPDDGATLRADVETCVEALGRGVPPRTLQRALWFPTSVLRREHVVASDVSEVRVVTGGGVTDHVG
ncbi:transglutaminaseTgpA domain-containing protein [Nocardioides sp. LHG3406-4]|uniref:transglutaminase family protein n=1 Tax=Nocardioides sp. LHG3406-4 TaxID=2804575 RepID=UPI003CE9017E